jgi:hypothetical protein
MKLQFWRLNCRLGLSLILPEEVIASQKGEFAHDFYCNLLINRKTLFSFVVRPLNRILVELKSAKE